MANPICRAGIPKNPSITTAGTEGTSARVLEFSTSVRPCLVTNLDSNAVNVVVNQGTAASATVAMWVIAQNATVDVSLGGLLTVTDITLYMAAGDYDNVLINGWDE